MVVPWLIIGASAALESSRRNRPGTQPERRIRHLKDVEHSLRERQKELAGNLEEAVKGLTIEREAHATDKEKLTDLSAHIQEIENRMVQLQEMTDGLVTENEQLKIEKSLVQEEARYAQKENQELRQETQLLRLRNTELEGQIDKIARDSEVEVARVTELLEELKSEVAEAMTSFTKGGEAQEFLQRMEKMGITLDCNLDDLQKISMSEPARGALEEAVTTQFNSQMGLVMEDRSRLEHLMGIAQNLRLKSSGSGSHSVSSTDRPSFDKPARLPLQPDTKAGGSIGFGGGILSALNFSKDAASQDALPEATSSIPSVLGEQAEVEKKMQSMQVTAAPEEPTVSGPETVTVENVPKAQKAPMFKLKFKGLQEPKKPKVPGMPAAKALQGEDAAFSSNELILK